jgi:hypothetical protein
VDFTIGHSIILPAPNRTPAVAELRSSSQSATRRRVDAVVSGARALYLGLVWIYLAAIVVQVFLAGVGLFGATHDFEPHRNLGWILHLGPVLLLVVAAVARVGARTIWWNVALLLTVGVQPFLPGLRNTAPLLAALHPVLALVIFWITLTIGLRTWRLVRPTAPAAA